MFQWDNPFCWSYKNNVADSMKQQVKAMGGDVDVDLRFSIRWNNLGGWDKSDYDAHCVVPGDEAKNVRTIYFSRMTNSMTGGYLDVDVIDPKEGVPAVENIRFKHKEQMRVGESTLWSISTATFAAPEWAGAYSQDWVDIVHNLGDTNVPPGAPITLHILASQNSLYLQSVELTYTAPELPAYTVSFDTHIQQQISPVTESRPGAGITLPDVQTGDPNWMFYGWARTCCYSSYSAVAVNNAGAMFYPESDCTLHAVYVQADEPQPWYPTDELTSGDYMMALYEPVNGLMLIASGQVTNGLIPADRYTIPADNGWVAMPDEFCKTQCIYTLQVSDDTLAIQHKASNTSVYLSNKGKFALTNSSNIPWLFVPSEAEHDAMPHYVVAGKAGNNTYYISYSFDADTEFYFAVTADSQQEHNLLFYALDDRVEVTTLYTSFPFGGDVTTPDNDNLHEYRMNIGTHTLVIKNGKKYLQINQ